MRRSTKVQTMLNTHKKRKADELSDWFVRQYQNAYRDHLKEVMHTNRWVPKLYMQCRDATEAAARVPTLKYALGARSIRFIEPCQYHIIIRATVICCQTLGIPTDFSQRVLRKYYHYDARAAPFSTQLSTKFSPEPESEVESSCARVARDETM